MSRRLLTEVMPWLLPLRQWQRKHFFYLKLKMSDVVFAGTIGEEELPYVACRESTGLYNRSTGLDFEYQINKVHNLKLLARQFDRVLIRPGETLSFWKLARYADLTEKYRAGLVLVNGELKPVYGGGLCQLSNLLYHLFLQTPLTVTERRGHDRKGFPDADADALKGVDATVSEGWIDLKVRNDTPQTWQIRIGFTEAEIWGEIRTAELPQYETKIINGEICYIKDREGIWEEAPVIAVYRERSSGYIACREHLYTNKCLITYPLPPSVIVSERRDIHDQ